MDISDTYKSVALPEDPDEGMLKPSGEGIFKDNGSRFIARAYQVTSEERVKENDENRLAYHKYYTGEVWGKADQYDLTINSCRLGFIRTEELIEHYVDQVLGR